MGEASLEVYNTVYNVSPANTKFKVLLNDQKLEERWTLE